MNFIYITLLWLGINLSPVFIDLLFDPFEKLARQAPSTELIALSIYLIFLYSLLEIVVVAYASLLVRRYKYIQLLLVLPIAIYIVTTIISWIKYLRFGTFISLTDIKLVSYLLDPASLSLYFDKKSVLIFLVLLSLTLLFTFHTIKLFATAQNIKRFSANLLTLMLVLVLINSAYIFINKATFDKGQLFRFIKSFKSPMLVLALEVSFPGAFKSYSEVELDIQSIINEYSNKEGTSTVNNRRSVIVIVVEALRSDIVRIHLKDFLSELKNNYIIFDNFYAQSSDTESSLFTIISGQYQLKAENRKPYEQNAGAPSIFNILRNYDYASSWYSLFDWNNMIYSKTGLALDYVSDPAIDGGALELKQKLADKYGVNAKRIDNKRIVPLFDELNMQRKIDWIKSINKPYLSFIYLYSSHFPYETPPQSKEDLLSTAEYNYYYFPESEAEFHRTRYINSIINVFKLVSQFLEKIKAEYDNLPIVIITGDHGEEFYEHGFPLHVGAMHQEIIKVPLIILNAEQTCLASADKTRLSGHVDLAPTILDLLELPSYKSHQGISLCASQAVERKIFGSSQILVDEDYLIKENYKLVKNFNGQGIRLFNLASDPSEQVNIFDLSNMKHATLLQELEAYRNKQLSYYLSDKKYYLAHYPPKQN